MKHSARVPRTIPLLLAAVAIACGTIAYCNPLPVMGACCMPITCYWITPEECAAAGGIYMGDGIGCDPDPCNGGSPVSGACCLPDGSCEITYHDPCEVAGGIFHYTLCNPSPCTPGVTGGCCQWPGTCTVLTPQACEDLHGIWMGYPCSPNPCPQCVLPCSGACCFPDNHCEMVYEGACDAAGGLFYDQGFCTVGFCDVSGVQTPPEIHIESWGKIKSTYGE
jgi:hypothetical protein